MIRRRCSSPAASDDKTKTTRYYAKMPSLCAFMPVPLLSFYRLMRRTPLSRACKHVAPDVFTAKSASVPHAEASVLTSPRVQWRASRAAIDTTSERRALRRRRERRRKTPLRYHMLSRYKNIDATLTCSRRASTVARDACCSPGRHRATATCALFTRRHDAFTMPRERRRFAAPQSAYVGASRHRATFVVIIDAYSRVCFTR